MVVSILQLWILIAANYDSVCFILIECLACFPHIYVLFLSLFLHWDWMQNMSIAETNSCMCDFHRFSRLQLFKHALIFLRQSQIISCYPFVSMHFPIFSLYRVRFRVWERDDGGHRFTTDATL